MFNTPTSVLQETSPTALSVANLFYFLLISTLILCHIYWRVSRRHMIELAEKLPGPDGLPLIGHALDFLSATPSEMFKRGMDIAANHKHAVGKVWFGPILGVFLLDPRDIELILGSPVHLHKTSEYDFFKPWFANGLLISTGDKWRAHRKLIAPAFHLNILKSFVDLFNINSGVTVEKLRKESGNTFDCHDYMLEATVDILLETVMGVTRNTSNQSGFEYAQAVVKMCDILHLRHTTFWLRSEWLFSWTKYAKIQKSLLNTIHSLTGKVVKTKKEVFNKGVRGTIAHVPKEMANKANTNSTSKKTEIPTFGQSAGLKDDLDVEDNDVGEKKRLAFLDLLIEAAQDGTLMTDEEVKQQVDTIMFEGHDTTAAASSYFLTLMGIHQDIQAKVIQELDEIFGGSDRPATFNDTLEMKYLERCLLETLRMYPPVPMIGRKVHEDIKLVSGDYTIPAGASVGIPIIVIHRQQSIYPNPDIFDPDNFLPERSANRHYYSFIPFSAGPRSCVGRKYAMLKLKVLLSTILRNFQIHSNMTEKDFQLRGDIILKNANGCQISLSPRTLKAASCR